MSREFWAGAGPCAPVTIDLDSTLAPICLAKEGAHYGYTGRTVAHPASAAGGTGRLDGQAAGGTGLPEALAPVDLRESEALTRQLTMRADSGFIAAVIEGCPLLHPHSTRSLPAHRSDSRGGWAPALLART